jgi:hypothetical protein
VLCDTYSVSSSSAFTVTLVRMRERHGAAPAARDGVRAPRSSWRLLPGSLRTTPATSPAGGTAPQVSLADVLLGRGVRRRLALDDWLGLMMLLPGSLRLVC